MKNCIFSQKLKILNFFFFKLSFSLIFINKIIKRLKKERKRKDPALIIW